MADVKDEAIDVLKKFVMAIKGTITIERVILFGSFARGDAGEWSDMDVAVVSPDFSGIPFYDRKRLAPLLLKVDTRIETHPFRPEDFTEDDELVREIIKNGVELKG